MVGAARSIVIIFAAAFAAQAPGQTPGPGKKVAIERLALHQFEDGPVLDPAYEFVPGETAYIGCRVTGYQIVRQEQEQSVKLSWQMRVADPTGVAIEKDQSGRIDDHVLPQDKSWLPKFISSFIVPAFAPTGIYRVTVKIVDEASNVETSGELAFHVRGRDVEPSDTLIARNFQFLRAENDRRAMTKAIYHPSETLWARFDIAGYKFGEGNLFSVDYGLAILRPNGDQVFAQPVAAAESKASYYPQRYVPGALSLTLDPNVPKGSYVLMITVRDKLSDQTWETKQPFEIE